MDDVVRLANQIVEEVFFRVIFAFGCEFQLTPTRSRQADGLQRTILHVLGYSLVTI